MVKSDAFPPFHIFTYSGFQMNEAYSQGHAVILGILRNFEVPLVVNSLPRFASWVAKNISPDQIQLYCETARNAKTKRSSGEI